MPGTWARSQAEHHRIARTCTHSDREPKDGAPHLGSLGPRRVSITGARQPVNRGTRPARPGFRPRDRSLGAHHARHMGTIPGRASPNFPHMHAQRPRTQGPGTSPRITWTPKGLHHRSKATSQPRHTTGTTWISTEGPQPGGAPCQAHGHDPRQSIAELPAHALTATENPRTGHLTSDHLDPEGPPSPKQGNQSTEAHDRMTSTTWISTEGPLPGGAPCQAHGPLRDAPHWVRGVKGRDEWGHCRRGRDSMHARGPPHALPVPCSGSSAPSPEHRRRTRPTVGGSPGECGEGWR